MARPGKKSEAIARAQMKTTKAIGPIKEITLVRGNLTMIRRFGLAVLTFFVGLDAAQAGAISVANPGFESPATMTTAAPSSWTPIGTTSNVFAYNPYELGGGNVQYVGANATTDPANGGAGYPGIFGENLGSAQHAVAGSGFQQTLSAVFTANTAYTLTVEEGGAEWRRCEFNSWLRDPIACRQHRGCQRDGQYRRYTRHF